MRISVVDPAAYTPPYDRALCAALAGQGLEVELLTRPFRHGETPAADGAYTIREDVFGSSRAHPGNMAKLGRRARGDVLHFQWFPLQELDQLLLPRGRPIVLTAHDVLPRQPRRFQHTAQRRLYDRVDAVIAHTEHSRERLAALGVAQEKLHVIPHGAFDSLASLTPDRPGELPEPSPSRPVALFYGLLRPYKGLDVLLSAWRQLEIDAELWIVGAPRMDVPSLPPGVRIVSRFVTEAESAWCFKHADLVVLPYREIEGSGVLFTALGLGKAILASDVGGFAELGDAVSLILSGDSAALAAELGRLLTAPEERAVLASAARDAAHERFAWEPIAAAHTALYRELV